MSVTFSQNVSNAAQRDIAELEQQIAVFESGKMSDDAFRKFRLARGVYGQRQAGVQMIRIKLPYGRVSADQLVRIADCSDKYATGNLHATTRQDIQLHFVKLADSPALWAELEDAQITLREACGNTVRNVTASPKAGIDPEEPFDVTPYANAIFEYFLRNPICQDMGRKFKIAVSSSEKDSAFAFMHDVGLIPRVEGGLRGFKVLIGGGLGAQPYLAQTAYEFLEEQKVIPFIEAFLRVFDRYGERTKRHKARSKYLLQELGLETLMEKINEEQTALKNKEYWVEGEVKGEKGKGERKELAAQNRTGGLGNIQYSILNTQDPGLNNWLKTNVFEQKQKGWYAAAVRVLLGDMNSDTARAFAQVVRQYADASDIRVTANQGYLIRNIEPQNLPALYEALNALDLAEPGFDTTADITTCPGTDTCNLAISSSYGITRALEKMMKEEFFETIYNNDIKIKISGCMNGCGQHSIANIGFHGSSIKNGQLVLPALQVLLGGGFNGKNEATAGDKVVKIPSKRGPEALRRLLRDFDENAQEGEYYNDYYLRQGEKYFYSFLKPLADPATFEQTDYIDWDHDEPFATAVGVGECASVIIDLVATTLIEADEKAAKAAETLQSGDWADAIYHAYNTFVTAAKAVLTSEGISCNSQHGVINDFDKNFVAKYHFYNEEGTFKALVLSINKNEPTETFARYFVEEAQQFLQNVKDHRAQSLLEGNEAQLSLVEFGKDS